MNESGQIERLNYHVWVKTPFKYQVLTKPHTGTWKKNHECCFIIIKCELVLKYPICFVLIPWLKNDYKTSHNLLFNKNIKQI